jgi:hypothetical protein
MQATRSFRWRNLTLVRGTEARGTILSVSEVIQRAGNALKYFGATEVETSEAGTLSFARRWFSFGHSWMIYVSRGTLTVDRRAGGIGVTLEASLLPLVVMGFLFFTFALLVGMPPVPDLVIVGLFLLLNGLDVYFGLGQVAKTVFDAR